MVSKSLKLGLFFGAVIFLSSCYGQKSADKLYKENLTFAVEQTKLLAKTAKEAGRNPRTLNNEGEMHWTNKGFDWTAGFFPGTCWYLYEYTNDAQWEGYAEYFQSMFEDQRFLPYYHDLGFVFHCSYGNGYRLTGNEAFKNVLIDAGNTLITRFNPTVGCIMSWDVDKGWQATRGWQFPVIIDNMMNLEMLFELTELTGDDKYAKVAISHADVTMKNHFRDDMSSYHVIDYDTITGEVRNKHTAQGYAHESSWARGQAWGIYGYTLCYRYTKDAKYLDMAEKIADFILNDPRIPADHIPYWDYDAPKIPDEPRDASAAAITASALIEMSGYGNRGDEWMKGAMDMLTSLSSDEYRAKLGENHEFILKHSVGSIPHNNEIDVPLNYADYYYVEALMRLKKLDEKK